MTLAIDRNTALCLACCSSLPPTRGANNSIFITNCCERPICPSCIATNPRLARYNPCLFCLAGVDLVASGPTAHSSSNSRSPLSPNITGAIRDEDTFVLGDDDDDDDDSDTDMPLVPKTPSAITRNALDDPVFPCPFPNVKSSESLPNGAFTSGEQRELLIPHKYFLKRGDTLQGLSLKFKVDSREICKLNNLPTSTIRTTPHLLHTRTFILLPPHVSISATSTSLAEDEERAKAAQIVREKAERKLQVLTKEADWRVAKAYVALAGGAEEQDEYSRKLKEVGGQLAHGGLAGSAIARYLEDDEWEAGEGKNMKFRTFSSQKEGGY